MDADALFDDLTEPQKQAVAHTDGPLLVLAGAGSGKTRVITRRAAYIAATVASPDQVLAITFTNKAAGEMRERIAELGALGDNPYARMWVCTFHSLCARLLRLYADAAGVSRSFTILDDGDRAKLVREAIEACELRVENWTPSSVEHAISDAKNNLLTPQAFAEQATDFHGRTVARIYEAYQALLARNQAVDFDDLLMLAARLLTEQDDVRAALSDRFRYLLIDEYQDTNHAQYIIASRLAAARRNICATGDPDQSIYAWRGANIQNILDFEEEYPDATVIRLEQNFRSTGAILAAASAVIACNQRRKDKALWTEQETGPAVRVWRCEDERAEAQRIAEDIAWHLREGRTGGDVAVFYRVNAMSRAIEDALRAAGIPYQIARGVEFYNRKEIRDVLAYLRAIVNPADQPALFRAMCNPSRGIGSATQAKIRALAEQQGITVSDALEQLAAGGGAVGKKLAGFTSLMRHLRAMSAQPVRPIVEAVLSEAGFDPSAGGGQRSLGGDASGWLESDAVENVRELVTAARQFDQDNPDGTLTDWLQQISLVSDTDALDEQGGAVTLMTLHTAKGLEFPLVYIAGLEENLLPHRRALREGEDDIEEERRLFFVGMTRAMDSLTITHAKYRMTRGITERSTASRFLSELPAEGVEHESFEIERDRARSHLGEFNEGEESFDASGYYPGQRVRHDEYGEGTVLTVETRGRTPYVRIHFDCGERSFALEHVSLYIMDGEC